MAKLLLLAILPVLFAAFLTEQLHSEKAQNVIRIKAQLESIREMATISRMIDQLQIERRYSADFYRNGPPREQLVLQRQRTDSLLALLERGSSQNLKGFMQYAFLDDLDSVRKRINAKEYPLDLIMHFYASAAFRFGTFNHPSFFDKVYLPGIYADLMVQKLLGDLITYQGIIDANIYNLLYTKKYIPETLLGTLPSYDIYKSYEKELMVKADKKFLHAYQQLKAQSPLGRVQATQARIFASFQIDTALDASEWRSNSLQSLNAMRQLQTQHLANAEDQIELHYEREVRNRNQSLVLLILFSLLFIVLAVAILISINKSLGELTRAAVMLSKGKTGILINAVSNDAIGTLAASISAIDTNNKKLTTAAQKIGKGDFNTPIEVRSELDQLGNAIKKMKEDLLEYTTALQRSKEEFETMADFMPQIIWTADSAGNTMYYNKKWYEITGLSTGSNRQTWQSVVHPSDISHMMTQWHHSIQTGGHFEAEFRICMGEKGAYRWHLARALPVTDQHNNIVKWFGTSTDMHDRKMQNEKLEEMVTQRTIELNRSNEDLQQFAHIASHDLKEPLRKITLFSNRLEDEYGDLLPPKGKIYLDKVYKASVRMSNLIDEILAYASLNGSNPTSETVELDQIVHRVKEDLEVLIMQKNASILHEELPAVTGAAALLFQLFYNLVNNALKFSKPGVVPLIEIGAEKRAASAIREKIPPSLVSLLSSSSIYHHVTVKDNGIGFSPLHSERIFQAFTRLNGREKIDGTGLGLALCKRIVYRHNGLIFAESVEGEGSIFHIIFVAENFS